MALAAPLPGPMMFGGGVRNKGPMARKVTQARYAWRAGVKIGKRQVEELVHPDLAAAAKVPRGTDQWPLPFALC
jgi:hypothetical protein